MSLYRMVPYNYDSAPIGVPATMQLVVAEPTDRICVVHCTQDNSPDKPDVCWRAFQLKLEAQANGIGFDGPVYDCGFIDLVRVEKEDNDASA